MDKLKIISYWNWQNKATINSIVTKSINGSYRVLMKPHKMSIITKLMFWGWMCFQRALQICIPYRSELLEYSNK